MHAIKYAVVLHVAGKFVYINYEVQILYATIAFAEMGKIVRCNKYSLKLLTLSI